jgi:methyl-accepting chemotaxis protein
VAGQETFREGLGAAGELRRRQQVHQAEQEHVVEVLAEGLQNLASGNMHTRIHENMGEGYAGLVRDFNRAAEQLSNLVDELTDSASNILQISETIGSAAEDLSARTENSAASLEETAAALQMVTGAVTSSADSAKGANQVGQGAIAKAETGAGIVSETVEAMGEIDKSSEEIARISGSIDDIAFQTNLLALNAGVEAARAGQAGSGFAVVAGEVQALSQRTAEAAGQISQLIANSGEKVTHGVSLVGRTGAALDEILSTVQDVTNRVGEIASLSQEQSQGLSEVNAAVGQLDQATQQNAAMFQRTSDASQALVQEGARLRALVGQFNGQSKDQPNALAQSA